MDLESTPQRRRGSRLEADILDAAWQLLGTVGFDNLTFEAVAQAAGTSRSVLYRRWPDREALVFAAIDRNFWSARPPLPDTGTLRDDLIELLRLANVARAPLVGVMSALMGSYFSPGGMTFAALRERMLGDRIHSVDLVLQRAVERGEADPTRLTARVRAVPFDLFRHDLLMTLSPLADDDIVAIVDEVFLPLVRPAT
jgi:AcrR family transcriptional regulator